MKAICSCLSLWVWLLWQCRETQAVEEEPPSTGKGKTAKSAKGKNGKTGKSSEGKTGKSGKSGVDGGDCECSGVEEFRYLTKSGIYEKALEWLQINTGVDSPDVSDANDLPLTQTQAASLAPANCYLATPMNNFELSYLTELSGGALGWVGAFKDFDDAYSESGDPTEDQRNGWMALCGATVNEAFWAEGEPPRLDPVDTSQVQNGVVLVNGMLAAMNPQSPGIPGAYYRCCYQTRRDSCFVGGNLGDVPT